MKRFSVVDHFVIFEQLYCESVTEVCVYHEVDNTSDHEPIGLKLHVDAQQYSTQSRSFVSKVAWNKAKQQDLDAYSRLLRDNLAQPDVRYSAVMCRNLNCEDVNHCCSLTEYIAAIIIICMFISRKTDIATHLGTVVQWTNPGLEGRCCASKA